MEYIINYIIDLTDEIYFKDHPSALSIYLHGGCYDLAKMLQLLVSDSNVYVNYLSNHCVVEQDGFFYDASGLIKENIEEYHVATLADLKMLQEYSKECVKGLRLYEIIGSKIKEKGAEKIIKEQIRKELANSARRVA